MRQSRPPAHESQPGTSVKVVVRARPPLPHEAPYGHCARTDGRKVVMTTSACEAGAERQRRHHQQQSSRIKAVQCEYDHVLGMTASQADVWSAVSPAVDKALEGFNVTVFTYGMTGSGKTFTMLGPNLMESAFEGESAPSVASIRDSAQRGLMPRVIESILDRVGNREGAHVTLSYIQIYQERCYDLLQPATAARPLRIREERDSNPRHSSNAGSVYLEGLTEWPVQSSDECIEKLLYGFSNVAFRATNYNEQSSRAHCVLTLTVQQRVKTDQGVIMRESKVRLVDLAGNERWDTMGPGMDRQHARELTAINKSLHVLGNCIQVLSHPPPVSKRDGQPVDRHVPYRDSALTLLLRDSLSGNSFSVMLCTICSSTLYQVQTLCTLRFADRAKRVKMKAQVCDTSDSKVMLQQTQSEIEYLRAMVAQQTDSASQELKKRIAELQQGYSNLEGENRALRDQIAEMMKQHHQEQEAKAKPWESRRSQQPFRRVCSEPALPQVAFLELSEENYLHPVGDSVDSSAGAATWSAEALSALHRGRSVSFLDENRRAERMSASRITAAALQTQEGSNRHTVFAPRAAQHPRPSSRPRSNSSAGSVQGYLNSEVGCCPQGHKLTCLGSGLHPLPAAAAAAYSEWHCDSTGCAGSSARTPDLARFHCAECQHDLCQRCLERLLEKPSQQAAPSRPAGQSLDASEEDGRRIQSSQAGQRKSAYAVPSRPPGAPRRESSFDGRRFRPASASRVSSTQVASAPSRQAGGMTPVHTAEPVARGRRSMSQSSQSHRQQGQEPKRSARSASSRALHQRSERSRRENEPSAADKARHTKLQEYFDSKFGEPTSGEQPVSQDPKVALRGRGPRQNLSVGSSYTSFASASTAPTTPEAAAKVRASSGQSEAPAPPDSQRSLPVPPASQSARGSESPRLPQLSPRPGQGSDKNTSPRRPLLEATSGQVQQHKGSQSRQGTASPSASSRSPRSSSQKAHLTAPGNVALRLSALSSKLKLDSLLSPKPSSTGAEKAVPKKPPAAFAAAAAAGLGGAGPAGASSMRALLGELDARREASTPNSQQG
eukprot:TRINITY_DN14698_c0_g1_i3.p1 TRINITY_DN14698_c0_g1~~TRINITY_DN14698_c0_g1_i3.p1  ORF type:complete len:1062 (+),score=139.30 TRINITY_DN14698_c0_g1_i3:111-3296(+)